MQSDFVRSRLIQKVVQKHLISELSFTKFEDEISAIKEGKCIRSISLTSQIPCEC